MMTWLSLQLFILMRLSELLAAMFSRFNIASKTLFTLLYHFDNLAQAKIQSAQKSPIISYRYYDIA